MGAHDRCHSENSACASGTRNRKGLCRSTSGLNLAFLGTDARQTVNPISQYAVNVPVILEQKVGEEPIDRMVAGLF